MHPYNGNYKPVIDTTYVTDMQKGYEAYTQTYKDFYGNSTGLLSYEYFTHIMQSGKNLFVGERGFKVSDVSNDNPVDQTR